MRILSLVLLFSLCCDALRAQKPTIPAADATHTQGSRAALARAVAKAHRPDGDKTEIDRYTADLVLTPLRAAEQGKDIENIDITLAVRYGAKIARAKGKPMAMLRYEINEGGKRIIRGVGARGLWHRIGDKQESLDKRDFQTDREILITHLRLCKQMLRFLDPAQILSQLRSSGSDPVREESLRVGRGRDGTIDALHIEGSVASFPVLRQGKQIREEMVWMKAWVDKKTSRLRAVKIFPLSEQGQPQTAVGEFILLDDYLDHEGVLVPRQLTFFQVKGGTRAPTLKIRVTKIVLNPPLTGQDFAE